MAKRKRHTINEIASKLREAEKLSAHGRTQREIANALGVTVMTLYRWRKTDSSIMRPETGGAIASSERIAAVDESEAIHADRVAELKFENSCLRKLVTDLLLEKMRLEDEAKRSKRWRTVQTA
jgi:putative transposase